MKIPVIAVVGPTASGKTALGIRMAQAFGGEIVSADSMQIYTGMDIATAKPDKSERLAAVHHMIDFWDPKVRFSVADYVELAGKCIEDIASRGKTPVIVGGTGLYIDSLLGGISFASAAGDDEVRRRLSDEYDSFGGEEMLKRLSSVDADSAEKLHPNDKRRIVRALEISELSRRSKTQLDKESRAGESPYLPTYIGLTFSDRQALYDRINQRVDVMIKNGLTYEAAAANRDDTTAAQAIGHKELFPYIDGEISLEEAVENLKRETRRYAKRQLTWFRRNDEIHWIDCCGLSFDDIFEKAKVIAVSNGFKVID